MQSFETSCRHFVKIIPVQSCGGSQGGSWQVRVSGPSITLKCGFKCLYADANPSAVIKIVAEYLRANASELRKPLARPRILIGLDVETTDWDVSCSFTAMTEHFNAGFPCRADHTQSAGYVCGVGFSVFRPTHNGSSIYKLDQIVSSAIKLPKSYLISKKAVDVHGITDAACYEGQELSVALRPVIGFLQQGAEICCHNLRHETLVLCRELQKRSLVGPPVLSEHDASLLLRSLYTGHCTSMLARWRNNGYYRRLADEFQCCFGESTIVGRQHDPGVDSYKCALLFLHYNEACIASTTDCEVEMRQTKRAKSATTAL